MTVSIIAAVSLDGKLTRHLEAQVGAWTSPEDKDHLSATIKKYDVLLMGRNTYEAAKPKSDPDKLRVILTSHPENFSDQTIAGQREFYNETPVEAVRRLAKAGHDKVLIVGGPGIISPLLEAKLVDYLYLTLEPRVFGEGNPLAIGALDAEFQLESHQQLNDRGTMLLTYKLCK